MNRIILSIFTSLFLVNGASFAQDNPKDYSRMAKPGVTFCAVLKGERLVVVQENKIITEDVVLDNGITIRRDGTVYKGKELQLRLKNGDCINSNGDMVGNAPDKEQKENSTGKSDVQDK